MNGGRRSIPETHQVDDWSPDGRWLVTQSDRHPPHGSGFKLYLMRPDGTGQRRLTEGGGENINARFSPDSLRSSADDEACSHLLGILDRHYAEESLDRLRKARFNKHWHPRRRKVTRNIPERISI